MTHARESSSVPLTQQEDVCACVLECTCVRVLTHTLGMLAMLDIKKKYTKYLLETKGFRTFSRGKDT